MQIFLVILATAILAGCGASQQREISDRLSGDSPKIGLTGSPYHSRNGWNGTVELFLDARAPSDVVEATVNAVQSWNDAAGRVIIEYVGREEVQEINSLYDALRDSKSVIYYVDNWQTSTSKDAEVLGTTVWENSFDDRDSIIKGDILLNADEYLYQDSTRAVQDSSSANWVVDAETVILHELGHLLGLNHVSPNTDPDSVMHTHAIIGEENFHRVPSVNDARLIQELYK